MTRLLTETVGRLQALPEKEQNRIAAKLQEELDRLAAQAEPKKKRKVGLGKGRFEVPSDFTAPLPDAFWLGEA